MRIHKRPVQTIRFNVRVRYIRTERIIAVLFVRRRPQARFILYLRTVFKRNGTKTVSTKKKKNQMQNVPSRLFYFGSSKSSIILSFTFFFVKSFNFIKLIRQTSVVSLVFREIVSLITQSSLYFNTYL